MFDYLLYKDHLYQTKSFGCVMEEIRITENGRLVRDKFHYEKVPKHERPYPDGNGLLALCGSLRKVIDKANVDMKFHGCFNFYDDFDGKWVELEAKFTNGKLSKIKTIVDERKGKRS